MGGSVGRVISRIPVIGRPIKKNIEAKKKIAEETAAIQAAEATRVAASEDEKKRRKLFQQSLNPTGGAAQISEQNVTTGRLFGN